MADSNDGSEPVSRRRDLSPRRGGQLVIGKLKAHGDANYQFRAREDPSYYVKVLTSRGERTLWGKDLKRALTEGETRPKPGDLIGVRRIAREAVTVTSRQRDAEGRVIAQEERHAHRTRWLVEKVTFFAERARMARRLRDEQADVRESVRAHPELKSTFLSVRAAEEFAEKRIANPQDRERFLELVRGAMAGSIHKGEPLPSVRLREAPQREADTPQPAVRKHDEPTR
jgi:putative DNA primase/helicase